jgi:hypothetical protein
VAFPTKIRDRLRMSMLGTMWNGQIDCPDPETGSHFCGREKKTSLGFSFPFVAQLNIARGQLSTGTVSSPLIKVPVLRNFL